MAILAGLTQKNWVPGDIVALGSGRCSANRPTFTRSNSLKIEEAALTGGVCARKRLTVELVEADAGIGDRVNMAFKTQM